MDQLTPNDNKDMPQVLSEKEYHRGGQPTGTSTDTTESPPVSNKEAEVAPPVTLQTHIVIKIEANHPEDQPAEKTDAANEMANLKQDQTHIMTKSEVNPPEDQPAEKTDAAPQVPNSNQDQTHIVTKIEVNPPEDQSTEKTVAANQMANSSQDQTLLVNKGDMNPPEDQPAGKNDAANEMANSNQDQAHIVTTSEVNHPPPKDQSAEKTFAGPPTANSNQDQKHIVTKSQVNPPQDQSAENIDVAPQMANSNQDDPDVAELESTADLRTTHQLTPLKHAESSPILPDSVSSSKSSRTSRIESPMDTGSHDQSSSRSCSPNSFASSTSDVSNRKRPFEEDLLIPPPMKRPRVECALPVVPMQPKLYTRSNATLPSPNDEDQVVTHAVEVRDKRHTTFPGGRGVSSPTVGMRQRFKPSSLSEMSFVSKLAINRNPFVSRSHRPLPSHYLKRSFPSLCSNKGSDSVATAESPILINVVKSGNGGRFDCADGDIIGKPTNEKQEKITKMKPMPAAPMRDRISLDKATFTSPKDVLAAKKLLAGIHYVGAIIPKNEAMWLGAHLWIFTIEQLEYSLEAPSKGAWGNGGDLLLAVAGSVLVGVTNTALMESRPTGVAEAYETAIEKSIGLADEQTNPSTCTTQPAFSAAAATPGTTGSADGIQIMKDKVDLISKFDDVASTTGTQSSHGKGSPKQTSPSMVTKVDNNSSASNIGDPVKIQNGSSTSGRLKVEKSEGNNVAMDPSSKQIRQAVNILQRWRSCVERFKSGSVDKHGTDTFLLSGPIGQLLPSLTWQFLQSVRVKTLLEFFSVKKTEASPLIAYYRDWRKHCRLPPIKGYCLSRHLLGICIRLEKAVKSIPPTDAKTRKWMSSVLVTLTGSAKDFIIDACDVSDVDSFLSERTKEWADRLVSWRGQNNLPPLKGSGKVAMVSGWKTSLKDSLDIERGEGRILSEAELLSTPPRDPEDNNADVAKPAQIPEIKKKGPKKQFRAPTYTSGQSALHSEEFLISVLRTDNVRFLNSINIRNAEQLIECDKQPNSAAIVALVKFRTEATSVKAQPATCVRLMYDWTQRVKAKLEEIQSNTVTPLAKKRGPKARDESETRSPTMAYVPKKIIVKRSTRGPNKIFGDPMDALSSSSRAFLETMQIFDASSFLETKTSVISNAYVYWRETERMPPLKGYGAIATVSGWKAQIRKAAQDAGKHDLAATAPTGHSKNNFVVKSEEGKEAIHSPLDSVQVVPKSSPAFLFGLSTKLMHVQGPTGLIFAFELSVRKSTLRPDRLSTYLTYLGHHNDGPLQPARIAMELDSDRLPLLVDVSEKWEELDHPLGSSPFSSLTEGCGIFDVGKYGAIQLSEGRLDVIKVDIMNFLESKTVNFDEQGNAPTKIDDGANVFQTNSPLRSSRQIFYQQKPLERGQIVELISSRQPIALTRTRCKESPSILLRTMILNQISNLTFIEVKEILEWVLEQGKPQSCSDSLSRSQKGLLQRKLHWLAKSLLAHVDGLEKNLLQYKKLGNPDRTAIITTASFLLMTNLNFHDIQSADEPGNLKDGQLLELTCLQEEIVEEIEASLIVNGDGVSPSNISVYCELAMALRQKCVRAASTFLASKGQESLKFQKALLQDFCKIAATACDNLLTDTVQQLDTLVLERTDEEGVPESVIATGSDWHTPVFRPLEDIRSGDAKLNKFWYVYYQIFNVIHSVACCNPISWLQTPEPVYKYATLVSEASKCMLSDQRDAIVLCIPPDWFLDYRFVDRSVFRGQATVPSIPDSLPLFMGLVWPKLRSRFGWRIDAGATKSDVAFLPPGQKNRAKRRNDQTAKVKQERQQKRAKLDKKLKEVGFGYVPKLTKRLIVQTYTSEAYQDKTEIPVRLAFDKFSAHILSKTSNPESEANHRRIETIMTGLCECFVKLLPILDTTFVLDEGGDALSNKYGCEKLISMLVVIPSVLQQSGLPIRQIEDSTYVIKELVKFLTDHCDECFDPDYRPFVEKYGGNEEVIMDFLPSKLDALETRDDSPDGGNTNDGVKLHNNNNNGSNESLEEESTLVRDLLEPGDVNDLTDFTAMAMRQMAPCRAGVGDSSKKGRKHVPVGFPGLVCTHCWGMNEGKYFFTSPDSLGTAGGVIYSHLARCPKFPPEELKKLTTFRGQQAETRKRLKYGAQASYFSRLWTRLHNAKTVGAPGVFVRSGSQRMSDETGDDDAEEEKAARETDTLEFRSHIDLIEHIQRSPPWNKDAELTSAVKLYYKALHHGGRIFNTNAMVNLFSSEWLLATISPVSLHKHCSGAGMHG